jgi:hypothetical protein
MGSRPGSKENNMQVLHKALFVDNFLENASVQGLAQGYKMKLMLGLHYSIALSCLQALQLTVDQLPVNLRDVRLRLKGKEFLPSEFADLFAEYWNPLDEAELFVLHPGGLAPGEHQVDLVMDIRFPFYLPDTSQIIRPDQHLMIFRFDDQLRANIGE